MPKEIYLVKVGMTMTEGTVEEWYVADGESVELGVDLYRLETEKVNMDVEAEFAGTVRHIAPAGATLEPGDVIGWIYEQGEEIPSEVPAGKPNRSIAAVDDEQSASVSTTDGPAPTQQTKPSAKRSGGRIASSPAARRLAEQLGLDLAGIQGTGPRGRITREDVEAAGQQSGSDQSTTLSGMRRTIAQRMFESLQTTAQLTMTMEVDMDGCIDLRNRLNEQWRDDGVRIAYSDLIIVACATSLSQHPQMNAILQNQHLHTNEEVHVGIAVALVDGLIVPVIRNATAKSLREISEEAAALAERARNGKLRVNDVSGGTFTVSSLGMYGVDSFTPILNPPQTGILGVGGIYDSIRWEQDQPVKCRRMKLSLTWDHRVVDGAPAAEFLSSVKEQLEQPERLLGEA